MVNPDDDERHMRRCIELARQSEGRTAPNPAVGCVIVDRRGRVIAEGYHRGPGTRHAEADALAKIDFKARGCTVYCNLEPCHHKRNRTRRPCSAHLADAKIARLVIGMGDPIRSHAGGARFLRSLGVTVERNVLRDACRELNRPFVTWSKKGRPLLVLKAAVSLDGKIATRTGDSQWITGESARRHVHGLRNRCDAILVGIGTVLADDPRLTVRRVRGGRDPIRIVVDSRLRTPLGARVLPANTDSAARVIIVCTERAAKTKQKRLERAGADVWRMGTGPQVDVHALAKALGDAGVLSVLVEGGAGVHGALIDSELVDEVMLYMAPIVLGGRSPSWVNGLGVSALEDALGFRFDTPVTMLGRDILLHARRKR